MTGSAAYLSKYSGDGGRSYVGVSVSYKADTSRSVTVEDEYGGSMRSADSAGGEVDGGGVCGVKYRRDGEL